MPHLTIASNPGRRRIGRKSHRRTSSRRLTVKNPRNKDDTASLHMDYKVANDIQKDIKPIEMILGFIFRRETPLSDTKKMYLKEIQKNVSAARFIAGQFGTGH